jgi:2-polyprenyl-6-methoxyphenol hydroxylase-like FAD-dependent oxidoreductase
MNPQQHSSENVEVLVVGGGPVGLFSALCASHSGLNVVVLDHLWRGYGRGHATLLHGSVLRILDEYGLGSTLRAAGQLLNELSIHVDSARATTIALPSPLLSVPQSAFEQILVAALAARNVEIRAPYEATTFVQEDGGVNVTVIRKELVTLGSPAHYSEWEPVESSQIQARFVIGADGYASRTRAALGVDNVQLASAEAFAMFEVPRAAAASGTTELFLNQGLGSVTYALPGGQTRWGFQIGAGLDAPPDIQRLRELVAERAPDRAAEAEQVAWGTVVHFERRLVRRFGKGRVWLAGDAAHVTSPLGNQSMNVGLLEASELVRQLARAHATANLTLLEHYGLERQREWQKLLGVNVSFDLLPHAPPWLAANARRLVPALPVSGTDLAIVLEKLGLKLS